jgi:hypothetical protein
MMLKYIIIKSKSTQHIDFELSPFWCFTSYEKFTFFEVHDISASNIKWYHISEVHTTAKLELCWYPIKSDDHFWK